MCRAHATLLGSLPSEHFYVSPEAAVEALRRRTLFNVIDLATGWNADTVPLKPRAFSQREFQKRKTMSLLGMELHVASDDTIVAKLEWSRLSGGSARQRELVDSEGLSWRGFTPPPRRARDRHLVFGARGS